MTATQATEPRTHQSETAAEVVGRLRTTFNTGVTRPLDWRVNQLQRLRALLVENEQELIEALWKDLRKNAAEAKAHEIDSTIGDIDEALANLENWLQPRPVEVPAHFGPTTTAYTTYDPLGVVLVIAPWNAPLHLLIDPIIGALAAGNTVVAKPSEISVHTSAVASRLLREYFDADVLTVVEGGAEETTALLAQRFDHIFYTGNGTVGRIVMAAAAKHLTPVTLELGGKSPVFVAPDADVDETAKRLVGGKFGNAGQMCIAPDYVLADPATAAALVPALRAAVEARFGTTPQTSPDFGRIINERHFDRLTRLLDSGRPAVGGRHDRDDLYIAPTVLTDVDPASPIMQEEIMDRRPTGDTVPVATPTPARRAGRHGRVDAVLGEDHAGSREDAPPVASGVRPQTVLPRDPRGFPHRWLSPPVKWTISSVGQPTLGATIPRTATGGEGENATMDDRTMKAVLFDRFGGPEVLYVGRVPRPGPAPGEVLVRVRAFSVNGGELAARSGRARLITGRRFPQRIGLDFTGEIAALGTGATGVAVGDQVWGVLGRSSGFGSAAEYVTVRPERLGRVPDGLDLVAAAALPVATTAVTALRDKAALSLGERLLVRGAAGGVGNAAVQLGLAYGAEVTALARAANLDFVRTLGAHHAVDHRTVSPAELGLFDVVLDTAGTDLRAVRRMLKPGGRMVTIAFDLTRPAASLGYIAASAVHGRGRVRFFSGNPERALFDDLARQVTEGKLRPAVDTVFPLEETAAAHRALEAGGVRGKYVVRVD